jgi:N-carbamoyl-L-amino-acid hydrolase
MSVTRIDRPRFRRDFERLAGIGATPDGGVHRPALGEAHLEARDWFRRRAEADGLAHRTDAAGNVSATLACGQPGARTVLLGSHLDSVPYGGRFDGALGPLAALECLRAVRDAGLELEADLEAIDFTDEEGTLVGLLGSRALAGALDEEELAAPRGGREALERGLARAGLDPSRVTDARRDPASLAAFLELHIEQGPRLHDSGVNVGVVQSIVGMDSFDVVFDGRADHAGTTPMDARLDAGLAAARFVVEASERVTGARDGRVANFGRIAFEPGAYNIVPGRATLAVECRAADAASLAGTTGDVRAVARRIAGDSRVGVRFLERGVIRPSPCDESVQRAFEEAADRLGLSHVRLASGAGHDTMALAAVCPSGMIFVPSTGGSHSSREHCGWDDCCNGADVLLGAAVSLARATGLPAV